MVIERYREKTQLDFIYDVLDAEPTDECIEWPYRTDRHGYGVVWHKSVKNHMRTHRLTKCMADGIDNPPTNVFCRHLCHNKKCINPQHLAWGSQAENIADCVNDPTNTRYKLTEKDVHAIVADTRLHSEIAADYSLDESTVSHIKIGRTWQHITGIEHVRKRLTDKQALAIYHDNEGTQAEIAERHGVINTVVSHIKTGRNFAHVTRHKRSPVRKRLTPEIILEIYHAKGSSYALSKQFDVGPVSIQRIKSGKNHSQITGAIYKGK